VTIEQCPICGQTLFEAPVRYLGGAVENARGETIWFPDELPLHVECDAKLVVSIDEATDYDDLIARARAL
jgi:hypothetical protein